MKNRDERERETKAGETGKGRKRRKVVRAK